VLSRGRGIRALWDAIPNPPDCSRNAAARGLRPGRGPDFVACRTGAALEELTLLPRRASSDATLAASCDNDALESVRSINLLDLGIAVTMTDSPRKKDRRSSPRKMQVPNWGLRIRVFRRVAARAMVVRARLGKTMPRAYDNVLDAHGIKCLQSTAQRGPPRVASEVYFV